MPCYSTIQTQMIDLQTIERAANALGMKVSRVNENKLTLTSKSGRASLTLSRNRKEDKFTYNPYLNGTEGDYEAEILTPLVQGYAKETLKAWGRKNGYTLAMGKKPGEYELVSLKG